MCTFKEKQLLLSLPNQGCCVDWDTHKNWVGPCECCLHIPSQCIPSKSLNLSPAANFHQEKPFIKFTASISKLCSQNWLSAPQSIAGSNPALGVPVLSRLPLLSHRFKASAGHLEGVRRSALMHSLFLQMKVGKTVWFPVTHSPSSFWSVLTDSKFGEVCLSA